MTDGFKSYVRPRTVRRAGAEAGISLLKRRTWCVDISVTPANVVPGANAELEKFIAGETIAAGEPMYQDSSDGGKMKLGQADVAATATTRWIAVNSASDGQPITGQKGGDIDLGAVLVIGETYVLSAAAAGGIAPEGDLVATNIVTVLGVADAADNLVMVVNASGAVHA